MEFSEIVVKENPGLCRCCLSEGCYKDMGSEYTWMSENEVYADMLLECFDISITQHNEGPNGVNRLICEVCITRLRDACNFKKQVLDSEKKFIDMIGRGDFQPKMIVYHTQMKCEDAPTEEAIEETVEYLDDIDFTDDTEELKDASAPTVSDITASSLPVKGKRGRPKKNVMKTEKKSKIAKMDEKPKSSRAVSKGKKFRNRNDSKEDEVKIQTRHLLTELIETSTAMPFRKNGNTYRCFYCETNFYYASELKVHTVNAHKHETKGQLRKTINKNVCKKNLLIKLDISDLRCKICTETFIELKELIFHLNKHDKVITVNLENVLCLKLSDNEFKCLYCSEEFAYFKSLYIHLHRQHVKRRYICESCGLTFSTCQGLNNHTAYVHAQGDFRCRECGKIFAAAHLRSAHMKRSHDTKNLKCHVCNIILGSIIQKETHLAKKHDIWITKEFKCDVCLKSFKYNHMLKTHVKRVHLKVKNFTCDKCGDKFFEKKMLELHQIRHSDVRPYECDICFNKYPRKNSLYRHMKVHLYGTKRATDQNQLLDLKITNNK